MDSEDYQTNFHENRRMKMDAVKMCIFLHAEDLLWICIRDIILSVRNPQ